jgi:cold shock CspA family protein
MSKSQETFSKKEKEKKKIKKRQEKEERAAERRANNNKGKSFEEMLAYVDENGNITDTPPDPMKRREINQEEIQIGTPKQLPPDPADLIRVGTVTHFNDSKGYGFIRDAGSGESIFVHVNNAQEQLSEGNRVTFEVEKGPKGLNAVNVKISK